MEYNILLIIKTESGDEYKFRLNKPLSDKDFEIFIQDNLPVEYDEECGMSISEYEFIDINSIKKIDI